MIQIENLLWEKLHNLSGSTGRNKNQLFADLFHKICLTLKPDLFYEIGAHGAEFSIGLSKAMPQVKYFAFEANTHVYENYKNKILPPINYINKAIGSEQGVKNFYIPRSISTKQGTHTLISANSTSSLKKKQSLNVVYDAESCQSTTLDIEIAACVGSKKSILWVDVEGAVGECLYGAHQSLKNDIVAILVEVETVQNWLGQWVVDDVDLYLEMFGFISIARDCETVWQYNKIYIKKEFLSKEIEDLVGEYIVSIFQNNQVRPH